MRKDRLLTILITLILGFVLVESVLAGAARAGDEVASVSAPAPVQVLVQSRESLLVAPAVTEDTGRNDIPHPTHPPQLKEGGHEGQSAYLPKHTEPNRAFPNARSTDAPGTSSPGSSLRGPESTLAAIQIDVNYAHDWVAGTTGAPASVMLTVTSNTGEPSETATIWSTGDFGTRCEDWDSGNCPDIRPGDGVFASVVGARTEVNPVGEIIFTGVDVAENVVSATLYVEGFSEILYVQCEIWEEFGPTIATSAFSDGGSFSCDFDDVGWDLERGQQVAIRYYEPDGDSVINLLTWDWVWVNYAHNTIGVNYPAGYTFAYTVTDSIGNLKGTGSAQTEVRGGWGGDGFTAESWSAAPPDIQPWDILYFQAEDGYTKTLQVGEISGNVDVASDNLSGFVLAPDPLISLTVGCLPWGAWEQGIDAPGKEDIITPDGTDPYLCGWDPTTEYDLQPGQVVAAMYLEPDDDRVVNAFHEPAASVRMQKWTQGEPGVGGNFLFHIAYQNDGDAPAENVLVTQTLHGFSYLGDTSGFVHAGSGSGPLVWDLGTLAPGISGQFDVYVAVTASASQTVSSTARINTSSYNYRVDPSEMYSYWEGHVIPGEVHLNLWKYAWTGDPTPDSEFIFTVNACNYGPTGSTPATLTDHLGPELELVDWWADDPGWTEVFSGSHQLEVGVPAIPGSSCSPVHLRVYLPAGIEVDRPLTNTAWITASNDIEPDDNQALWEGVASPPRLNLGIAKYWSGGQLVPAGELNYHIHYYNDGNLPVGPFKITDTFPTGTSFMDAWFHDPSGGFSFEPDTLTDGYAVWSIPELENGFRGDFSIRLYVDYELEPGTILENRAAIQQVPGEGAYSDNQSSWLETLNPHGPNLRIHKRHDWIWDSQLRYTVDFENIGDEIAYEFWITDSLPADTQWAGDWDMDCDWCSLRGFYPDTGELRWWFREIPPGGIGNISFNVSLDYPGEPLHWYTNTVAIDAWYPGETNPGDNLDVDVAFSGGEVRDVGFWLEPSGDSFVWGTAVPGSAVTVTTPSDQFYAFAAPDCDGCWWVDGAINLSPGDTVEVAARAGLLPVSITIPDPLYAAVDTDLDIVSGQIGGWISRIVEVYGEWEGGFQEVLTDGGGHFLAVYADIPSGRGGYIRFVDQINYAEVIFHRPFYALDLILDVNYGHDWIEGRYEPGHTVWITVTADDHSTVKGWAEMETDWIPWWDGGKGFSTIWSGWTGDHPDILPGDWVFAEVDNGYTNTLQVGSISGNIDVASDSITGSLEVPWFVGEVDYFEVICQPWGAWDDGIDAPEIYSLASPGGSVPYSCAWDPVTEWDIRYGQNLSVGYIEPDGDRIFTVFALYVEIYLPFVIR